MIKIPNLRDVSRATKQVATRSAINPMLWKSAICFPIGCVVSLFAHDPLNYIIITVAALPVVSGCYSNLVFTHKNANRLQSEEHIENLQLLARISAEDAEDVLLINSPPTASNVSQSEVNK